MKALFTLRSAINQSSTTVGIVALISLLPLILPPVAFAAELQAQGQQSAKIFEIKVTDPNLLIQSPKPNNNGNNPAIATVTQPDPLEVSLHDYLVTYNSPLADYTDQLLKKNNWKTVIAISFVESNMCRKDLNYNCSGIGGPGHFIRFSNYGQWADYMSNLLATRYNGWSLDKMNGVYVQPRSYNWGYGSKKILAELTALEQQATAQKLVLNQKQIVETVALASLPTFSNLQNTN